MGGLGGNFVTPEQEKKFNITIRRSIWAILIGGLLVSTLAGLAARETLIARGVEIVSWAETIQLFIPLALWFEVSYGLIALWLRWPVRRSVSADPRRLVGLVWRLLGAFLGMAGVLGYRLFDLATYSGPGGFVEAVMMTISMSPITIPFLAGTGAIGAWVGFVVASGLLSRLHPQTTT
jgi:hypothetical protein